MVELNIAGETLLVLDDVKRDPYVAGDTPSVLDDVKRDLHELCELVHKFAFEIVFTPLEQQIAAVATMEVS